MSVAGIGRPPLHPELAKLKEVPLTGLVPDSGSYCTLHGAQPGGNCAGCDKYAPAEVLEARKIGGPVIQAIGFTLEQVQEMVSKAVANAMSERDAFEKWKASPEGQAAAAAAATAGMTPPDHGPDKPPES